MEEKIIEFCKCIFIFFIPILPPISAIAFIIALIYFFKTKSFALNWKNLSKERKKLFIASIILIIGISISVIFSAEKLISISRYPFFILCILVSVIFSYTKNTDKIIKWFIISGILVTIFGIIQYLTKFNIQIQHKLFQWSFSTKSGISSTMGHCNRFAHYLIMAIPLNVAFIKHRQLLYRILSYSFLLLSCICLNLAQSLAGLVAIGLVLILAIFIKNWKFGLIILIIGSSLGIVNTTKIKKLLFKYSAPSSFSNRIRTWKFSFNYTIKNRPITGFGLSTYKQIITKYKKKEKHPQSILTHGHSIYFHFFLETGFIGIISFFVFIITFCSNIFKCVKQSYTCYATFLSIISLLIGGIADAVLIFLPLALLFFTIIGIGWSQLK